MAQWGLPRPMSRFGSYHGAHGRSRAAVSDLGGGWQHSRREDAVAVRSRWGCGLQLAACLLGFHGGPAHASIHEQLGFTRLSAFWLTCC
jgi:hypothetical protein